jgi:hypothetical protein
VYYQANDNTLWELHRTEYNGQWNLENLLPGPQPFAGSGIAAIGWDANFLRIYFQDSQSGLWKASGINGAWTVNPMLMKNGTQITAQLGSSIAAIRLLDATGVRYRFL